MRIWSQGLERPFISVMAPESAWGSTEGMWNEAMKCRELGNPELTPILVVKAVFDSYVDGCVRDYEALTCTCCEGSLIF